MDTLALIEFCWQPLRQDPGNGDLEQSKIRLYDVLTELVTRETKRFRSHLLPARVRVQFYARHPNSFVSTFTV